MRLKIFQDVLSHDFVRKARQSFVGVGVTRKVIQFQGKSNQIRLENRIMLDAVIKTTELEILN